MAFCGRCKINKTMLKRNKVIIAGGVLVILLLIAIPISITSIMRQIDRVVVRKGAIVSNGGPCADIGMSIMNKYENAVDSMIATMLCDGVATLNNMGIGGGFVATLYIRENKTVYALNARETAPEAATEDMYMKNATLSVVGGLSVAVPGELMGYWEMYKRFGGKAPWKELFLPTIELCKKGVPINKIVALKIQSNKKLILENEGLRLLLRNDRGDLPVENDTIKMTKFAETLALVAEHGPTVLYNGSLSAPLINDIVAHGGVMTLQDLSLYKAEWESPEETSLSPNLTMYSIQAPSSGPILAFIFSLLDRISPKNDANYTSIVTEAFKFAYGQRSHLGDPNVVDLKNYLENLKDPNFINDVKSKLFVNKTSTNASYYGADYFKADHGTANMVVLAPNGDAIVTTSTINLNFGSKLVSESTGILLNNEMDDFSTPGIINYFGVEASPHNFIRPGARPVSSMCPAIFIDKTGDVRLAIGAAGGTKITTATALVAVRNLWMGEDLEKAVEAPRFHHQLFPMKWFYEPTVSKDIIEAMKARGHEVAEKPITDSCVTAISKQGDIIVASTDYRRRGNVSYFLSNQ